MMKDPKIDLREVMRRTRLQPATIARMIDERKFPMPMLDPGTEEPRWLLSVIQEWILGRWEAKL